MSDIWSKTLELSSPGGEEEDPLLMRDVEALAGGVKGKDALAALDSALRPVERYAVRWLEQAR